MKPVLRSKLDSLAARLEEVNAALASESATRDMDQFRKLSREHAELSNLVDLYGRFRAAEDDVAAAKEMAADPEMKEYADEQGRTARESVAALEAELQKVLLPRDPNDERNIFLEVRAGTGGDESALFAGDLFRMYVRYAERQGWQVEIISESLSELGGYKEVIARIEGHGAFSRLRFESGGHRVQRVPETEAQGRIHTSACTVAVLPEADAVNDVVLNPADLRIDTFRASGAGGQHVNKTDWRFASPTCRPGSSSSVRKSVPSTRTAPRPWPGWRPSCRTARMPRRTRKYPRRASCWSGPVIVPSASVPTISPRVASPTIGST